MYTRGRGRAIMGARGVWSTRNEGTFANPLLPHASSRNPTRIRIVNKQVNDENIIVIPDENQNEMVWPSSSLLSLPSINSSSVLLNGFARDTFNEFMYALPCSTFNSLNVSNHWDYLDVHLLNNNPTHNQENFQDANDQGNIILAGENNLIVDVSEGDNLGDDVLVDEDADPMDFDETLESQGIRKRSRNQLDSDDEMNNGSNSVNGP